MINKIRNAARKAVTKLKQFYDIYRTSGFIKTLSAARAYIWKNIKVAVHRFNITLACGPIVNTPPLKCDTGSNTEAHSLVCHRDLYRYITAIKSLLRFYGKIQAVVHDDGTLNSSDKAILHKHIIGIKIISRDEADRIMAETLKNFPVCLGYRQKYVNALQLFDYTLLSKTDKIISLDSDTLFFHRPDQLIEWISSENKQLLYFYEKDPASQEEVLSKIKEQYEPHLCIALMCVYKDVLCLPVAEELIPRLNVLECQINNLWFLGQNVYSVLVKRYNKCAVSPFDPDLYQDPSVFINRSALNDVKPVFRHYRGSPFARIGMYVEDVKIVIKELKGRITPST